MTNRTLTVLLGAVLAIYGCDEEGDTDAGVDSGMEEADAGGGTDAGGGDTPTCATYCDTLEETCTDGNRQYADRAECIAVCEGFGWAAGDPVTITGPATGNTIGCRTYHGGAPSAEEPAFHCPHAGPTGGNMCGSWCETYCAAALEVCTGDDAIYADMAECMTACEPLDDEGDPGATLGDTVQCRIYHLTVALVSGDTGMHCPHAARDGGGVCVGGWEFNDADVSTPELADASYARRVDRAGMPAVATALVGSLNEETARKETYNQNSPGDDGAFAGELVENLTLLHGALRDDIVTAGLTPCSTAAATPDVTACLTQEVAAGVSVQSLVVPDVISFDLAQTSSFPNGRDLTDPVIDLTLGVILLDITEEAPDALVGTNPTANDVAFLSTFPYLAPPHPVPAP